ncbi:hypothetical protein ME310_002348 [Salmonella enterica]|nr:hypothetical protein [Salmonella enterica]EKK2412041.1 hypothetical protein [Salmonella enterica]MBH0569592.1 hypothetical protein [Salmonella enterica]MBH0644678.1 hypothetical protein [Salmonella enterica]MBH5292598.1 hypothetical protein [Salmonella enterica]
MTTITKERIELFIKNPLEDDTVFYVHHREIYKAMLAAAQKPETGPCTK